MLSNVATYLLRDREIAFLCIRIVILLFVIGGLYSIPPIWKRLAAELIDFFILFYIKLMVTILLLKEMGFK